MHGYPSQWKVTLPVARPALRTSFSRQRVGQTSHRGIFAGLRQWDDSLIDRQNRCRHHPSSSCLFAGDGKKKPRGPSVEKDQAHTSAILFICRSSLNYLDSSLFKPKIPWPLSAPRQAESNFNLLSSWWDFQTSLSLGSSNQTGQIKICWVAFVLSYLHFSVLYIKVNVNYPLLSISPSSIIQNVIEKQYLNPVLTEMQAPSFPQGRHNWIPPEATDVKCRARWESRLSVVVVCI